MQTTIATPVSASSTFNGLVAADGTFVQNDNFTQMAPSPVATPTKSLNNVAQAVNVVLNDNAATVTAPASVTIATYLSIEQLVIERKVWEDGVYRTSNEFLYVLMQKCYQMYKNMEGTSSEAAALRSGLKDYINLNGLSDTLKNSHTVAKIVKCVFGTADRKRVSAYSIVLRSALAKDVQVLDLPSYIRNAGGIEHLRLAKSPNAMTVTQKAESAGAVVQTTSMGVFASPQLAANLDVGKIGENVVLIGTWQSDGSVIVRAVVNKDGVVNAALASYYTDNKAVIATATAEKSAANDANVKQEAIAQAAAQAVVNG
jgi:hypothetical protein